MSDWTQGYVADFEYTQGFYGDLAPDHLDLVCLVNSVMPPRRGDGFTYCELGSGHGLTSTALAAANPEGEFYAVDFNPAHTARAADLAAEAGVGNVTFLEDSFEVLAEKADHLPQFDYITMHGVWSWVSPELRAAIARFLSAKLRPGGLAYVSYNALPGWTGTIPVQYLLRRLAGEAPGRSDSRFVAAFNRVAQMADAGSPYLSENPIIPRIGKFVEGGDIAYLVHEYMTPYWAPQFHADVARELSGAKLDFVGCGAMTNNFPDLMLNDEQRELIGAVDDVSLRETMADYFNGTSFRGDVFARGRRLMEPGERDARLTALRVAPVVPRSLMQLEVEVPVGKATLNEPVYGPILDRLAEGPVTVGELLALPELPEGTRVSPAEIAGLLVAIKAAMPMRDGPAVPGPVPLTLELGRRVLRQSTNRASAIVLPRLGTAMACPGHEAAILSLVADLGTTDPRQLGEALWAPIAARGEALIKDGERLVEPEENIAVLVDQARGILESRLDIWRMHGALPEGVA